MEHIEEIFSKTKEMQMIAIDEVAKKIAEAIAGRHTAYILGASHAGILAQEVFHRTDSLAMINPILPAELTLNTRPVDQTSVIERPEGCPTVTLSHTTVQEGDVLTPHSVSGRSTAAIEMGIGAGKREVYMIAITSVTYASGATPRHSSGKELFKVCDMYTDNCGDSEDSSMLLPGMEQKIAPIPSVIRCGIVNMMETCVMERLLAIDVASPVFHSTSMDGGMEFNQVLFERYGEQIHYVKQPRKKIF